MDETIAHNSCEEDVSRTSLPPWFLEGWRIFTLGLWLQLLRCSSLYWASSIVSAASPSPPEFIAGVVLHTIGIAGIGLLATLFIADYTSLRWRGAALSWTYLPSLITIWVGPKLYATVPWRWIYGMTSILMFILCVPAGYLLFSAARNTSVTSTPLTPRSTRLASHMDLIGLSIFTLGFGLIEYNSDTSRDSMSDEYSPGRIAKLTIGILLVFPVFVLWELYGASSPLMPGRILRQKGVLFAIIVNFLFWFASAFPEGDLMDFVYFAWNSNTVGYLLSTSGIAYGASAPFLGLAYYVTRRYKPFLFLGNILFALGCGLWLYAARRWDFEMADQVSASMTYLFTIQVLIGIGNIAVEMSTLIGAQASVTHDDLAIATTMMSAWSQLATSVSLPVVTATFARLTNPTKSTVSLSLALGISILCILLSLFVPNYVLGSKQNAVEGEHQVEQDSLESQSK
ncbi:unnamed protein product [Rhizoctonia solani]|uniref:Uncharacterized protein n=1 Tax=Rhizoctonia solani TaxID=456999 RepID=A0A8H2WF81_9AGAM|nr:unnamed protein product [Rhizoctonia solani]